MSSISFDNVWVFYLAIPLTLIILIPFIIAIRKDNLNWHNVVALVLHFIIATLILFAASGVKTETVLTKTNIYVVADVSYSANRNYDKIDNHIQNVKDNLPLNSQMGIVCFGKDYELLSGLGEEIHSVRESNVDDSETNISQAVQFASSLFPDEGVKRLVIITDGKSTYSSDSLRSIVNNLVTQGIYVDAIYIDDNLNEEIAEVQISSVELDDTVHLGKESSVKLAIESNKATMFSKVNLYKNVDSAYELITSQMINLMPGRNALDIALDTKEEGVFDYKVEIVEENDLSDFNNIYYFTQTVSSAIKVLVYHGNENDFNAVASLYGENSTVVSSNIILDKSIPFNIGELCEYDEIVICDVDLSKFEYYELLTANIETVVSSFGKSLVTFGNIGVQAPAGGTDALSTLDGMLPVRFGTPTNLPKMYALVLDTSMSMNLFGRMLIGREAAKMLISLMGEDDYVYVGGFSGEVYTLQPPTKVSDCREELIEKIENFNFRQGTMIGAALSDTLNKVRNYTSLFSSIQVTLITDGRDYKMGSDITPTDAVQQLKAYGIRTSVILSGYTSGVNDKIVSEMEALAFEGGGTLYDIRQESDVASVILDEYVKEESKTEIIGNAWINVQKPRDAVLANLDINKIFVKYYVLCAARARATTVLTVDYYYEGATSTNKNIQVPLYAYWNYGNGRVSCYTGKLNGISTNKSNSQGSDVVNRVLFDNLINTAQPTLYNDVPFVISHNITDKTVNVIMTPVSLNHTSSSNLATIRITHPDNKVEDAYLAFGLDSYVYSFDMNGVGKYSLEFIYDFEGKTYHATKFINLAYMPEYNMFERFDQSALYTAVASTGEVIEEGTLKLENSNSTVEKRTLSLTIYLLIVSAVLYVIDIAIRRLKWNDIVSFFLGANYKKRRVKK